ncbi:hypothetical protein D039_4514B, partial [Vibrio parahaemolyticus EKP-028]
SAIICKFPYHRQ